MPIKPFQKPNPSRDKKIMEYRQKGYSLKQIAGIFHLSRQRVWKIEKKLLTGQGVDKGT